jgi:hypothetical protein
MFKHIDSESYLAGTIDPSAGDNGAFAVKVSDELSSNLIFKLEPYRSFEFDGMKIPFGSPVKIVNQTTGTYLTFEMAGSNDGVQRSIPFPYDRTQSQAHSIQRVIPNPYQEEKRSKSGI